MIQKIYDSYDDGQYYIACNKKKLAYDNMAVIGGMLAFFVFVGVFFVAVALAFGYKTVTYQQYLPPLIVLILLYLLHSFISKKIEPEFERVRIYALVIYTLIILNFSIADAKIYSESRAVFFPAAILVISSIYIDNLAIMLAYKVVLAIVFIMIERGYKAADIVTSDAIVAVLAILASSFCYAAYISSNISRREESVNLVKKSETDLLTGLLNKISFEEKCTEYLEGKMIGAKCTMFIFDLDDFKHINDNYGHKVGDEVLAKFSEIIRGYFHPDDLIGRIGGDEFMVLVLGEMPEGFAQRRCRSILHEFKMIDFDGASGITCSIGIVEDTQKSSFNELYERADKALYKAKSRGKAQFAFYED